MYWDKETNKHIDSASNKGTRYTQKNRANINGYFSSHLIQSGKSFGSRKDDLLSCCYVFIKLIYGYLPWQKGLLEHENKSFKAEQHLIIAIIKETTNIFDVGFYSIFR